MIILLALYALLAFIAVTNLLLMVRPGRGEGPEVAFLIPARNEAHNLPHLLPALAGNRVYVFDDESSDDTAGVARRLGAQVIRPGEPLPAGWTGKNRACYELAKIAAEDFAGEWIVFLDADVRPTPQFVQDVRALIGRHGARYPVMSSMPTLLSASFAEGVYMNWVVWLILATNPFGLVARSGMGHNMFLNGQMVVWRSATYFDLQPHEALKGAILEDVRIGRLLSKRKVRVLIADLSQSFRVRMYESLGQASQGMAKNSYEIADSVGGTVLLSLLLLTTAWAWLLAGLAGNWMPATAFLVSCLAIHVLAKRSLMYLPFWPISLTLAAWTFLRSWQWHRHGRVEWKGRIYGENGKNI